MRNVGRHGYWGAALQFQAVSDQLLPNASCIYVNCFVLTGWNY